jgi:hypothetical protein
MKKPAAVDPVTVASAHVAVPVFFLMITFENALVKRCFIVVVSQHVCICMDMVVLGEIAVSGCTSCMCLHARMFCVALCELFIDVCCRVIVRQCLI